MAGSIKKGPFVDTHLMKKVLNADSASDKRPIKAWSRRPAVLPEMTGITLNVHNGGNFVPVLITEDHTGHKLGEFAPTRTPKGHKGSVQRKA